MNTISYIIDDLIPHRGQMQLIDQVEIIEDLSASAFVYIHPQKSFYTESGIPSFVGVEYMAQTIGLIYGKANLGKSEKPKLGFLLSVSKYQSERPFLSEADQTLWVGVRHVWGEDELLQFEGEIRFKNQDGPLVATGNLNVYKPNNVEALINVH